MSHFQLFIQGVLHLVARSWCCGSTLDRGRQVVELSVCHSWKHAVWRITHKFNSETLFASRASSNFPRSVFQTATITSVLLLPDMPSGVLPILLWGPCTRPKISRSAFYPSKTIFHFIVDSSLERKKNKMTKSKTKKKTGTFFQIFQHFFLFQLFGGFSEKI